ncbi:MAG: TRAP-type C4-dicarboxylate transport system, large permease component [Firmicutes bacterium]|nr:TRAP-type C4-dicarboxylate transport system, large permease component [Bacillota bacterium]MDI6706245.1 TRAP transporter large permease [Bacillota bacterium]
MGSLVLIFFISTAVMLLIGVPISITIGASSLLYILMGGIQQLIAIQKLFAGINAVALLAIPFFILAGDLMNTGGIAKRLVRLANAVIGNMTGGLAIVTVLGCMFFAAISGSGVATAAALGSIMIPAMVNNGYDKVFATSVVASASPIGVIIPPSISFVIYGVLTGTSIADLYLAGIPAGIIVGTALLIVSYIICKKRGYKGAVQAEMSKHEKIKELWLAFKDSIWALGTPVILIGGVFGGIFTPTESAVVAVVYAIIVGLFFYREIKLRDLPKVILGSAKTAAKIMFIIANASLFAYVLTYEKIPQMVVKGLLGITTNEFLLVLIINIIMLIAGTFMETSAILIIMVPLLMPVLNQIGMDLTHFGIIATTNTAIGLLTPPFGVCLFTSSSVAKIPVEVLSRKIMPFLIAMIIALMIITYIPQSIMFLVK